GACAAASSGAAELSASDGSGGGGKSSAGGVAIARSACTGDRGSADFRAKGLSSMLGGGRRTRELGACSNEGRRQPGERGGVERGVCVESTTDLTASDCVQSASLLCVLAGVLACGYGALLQGSGGSNGPVPPVRPLAW